MEKFSLDKDWKFFEGEIKDPARTHTECYMEAKAGGARGGGSPDYDLSGFENINIPHDFAVAHKFEEKYGPAYGYKKRGKGWYFKQFRLEECDKDKELYIEFGGVSSNCTVYLNGSVVYRNFGGYNSFMVNITDMAVYGEQINFLSVFVDADVVEGWWYEGAGIYRHVNLYKCSKLHIKPWDIFINPIKKTTDVWNARTEALVKNYSLENKDFEICSYILDNEENIVGKESVRGKLKPGQEKLMVMDVLSYSPYLWDIDDPKLYTMVTKITENGECVHEEKNRFGFRTIAIDKDKGFFLNGRRVQIYGTCNHQDHAGIGVAVLDSILEYRIQLLKEMGSNAYRCSHGNPSKELLDLCDKYGILVMDENRSFNTSPDGLAQIRDMVKRDRNHPCVIMYSIFNEEPLQGTFIGKKLALRMRREIEKYDNTRFITGAMNGGVLSENGAVNELDITGFNYITAQYDPFRNKFPHIPMLGSENNSAFQTRGVYKTDEEKNIIDCYDSYAAPWGNTHRDGFRQVDTRKHIMGMFIWTGFDYRGEPTPFEYPSISTQFGIMDTCGFKKDAFYLNKAFFTDEPMIHIVPSHWNFEDGRIIKVMANTNCSEAELILNGESFGKKEVDKYDMCFWEIEYKKGTLMMYGFRDGIKVCSDKIQTASEPEKLTVWASKSELEKDCFDAVAVNVGVCDINSIPCMTADNLIEFEAEGGIVLGVGNGDPNSHEDDKSNKRRLFNGLCQAIISPLDGYDKVSVKITSEGLKSAQIEFKTSINPKAPKYIESVKDRYISKWRKKSYITSQMPDAVAKIEDHDMNTYETVTVANGSDELFDNTEGYGVYKTSIELPENNSGYSLIFREIMGDMVYIYINGSLIKEADCKWGSKVVIPLDGYGRFDIDVCIFSSKNNSAGITKPVVVVE